MKSTKTIECTRDADMYSGFPPLYPNIQMCPIGKLFLFCHHDNAFAIIVGCTTVKKYCFPFKMIPDLGMGVKAEFKIGKRMNWNNVNASPAIFEHACGGVCIMILDPAFCPCQIL